MKFEGRVEDVARIYSKVQKALGYSVIDLTIMETVERLADRILADIITRVMEEKEDDIMVRIDQEHVFTLDEVVEQVLDRVKPTKENALHLGALVLAAAEVKSINAELKKMKENSAEAYFTETKLTETIAMLTKLIPQDVINELGKEAQSFK